MDIDDYIAESGAVSFVRHLLNGGTEEGQNDSTKRRGEPPMELKLRDLVPRRELEEAITLLVDEILDRTVTFTVLDMTGQGIEEVGTRASVEATPAGEFKCPECGNTFESKAALGGHRYWKHAISKKSDKTPAELKEESSKRAHEYQESLKK